jgi:PAS domain-containing protein
MANLEAGLKVIFADRTLVRWPHDMEIEQIRKDGSTVWTEVRVTVMRTPDGTPIGFLGITRDISKRKAAEEALRELKANLERMVAERTRELTLANERLREEVAARARAVEALARSEARFRAMNENAGDIVSIVDRDLVMRYQSPSARRILGYEPHEQVGRNGGEFIHPDDAPASPRRWDALRNPLGGACEYATATRTATMSSSSRRATSCPTGGRAASSSSIPRHDRATPRGGDGADGAARVGGVSPAASPTTSTTSSPSSRQPSLARRTPARLLARADGGRTACARRAISPPNSSPSPAAVRRSGGPPRSPR